jgi:hypothetical protein
MTHERLSSTQQCRQKNTIVKNKNNLSSMGNDRPPNYQDAVRSVFLKYKL